MSATQLKMVDAGVFFLFIILSGFWLSSSGKPLNVILFTTHKLIALAGVIFLGVTVFQLNQVTRLNILELTACLATAVLAIGMFASGALLSLDKPAAAVVLRIHQVIPFLLVLATAAALYLLLFARSELPKT